LGARTPNPATKQQPAHTRPLRLSLEKETKKTTTMAILALLMKVILAILLPPVAVLLEVGE
jgi:hypothetical protein